VRRGALPFGPGPRRLSHPYALLAKADAAMYEAKRSGGNAVRLAYSPGQVDRSS